MIRIIAKLFAFAVALTAFSHVAPVFATSPTVTYVSSTGSDNNPCTAALPCATLFQAIADLFNGTADIGQVNCLNPPAGIVSGGFSFASPLDVTIDCHGVYETNSDGLGVAAANNVIKIRNLTLSGSPGGAGPAITFAGSGTLILENCVFENFSGSALSIAPNGALNLVITNSRISNNGSGIIINPAAGGSVTATFNGVTIADNAGGGLKTETTNGTVAVDISNSTIINNSGNGLNAVSGAGGANMLNIKNSVIARNGSAGIQANGTNAAALVNNTVLDSNTAGAISAVGSGRVLTYGNNSIVGSPGTGFTGTASLQ